MWSNLCLLQSWGPPGRVETVRRCRAAEAGTPSPTFASRHFISIILGGSTPEIDKRIYSTVHAVALNRGFVNNNETVLYGWYGPKTWRHNFYLDAPPTTRIFQASRRSISPTPRRPWPPICDNQPCPPHLFFLHQKRGISKALCTLRQNGKGWKYESNPNAPYQTKKREIGTWINFVNVFIKHIFDWNYFLPLMHAGSCLCGAFGVT